ARVVRGVAVVLHAVEGELGLPARVEVPYPEVPVANEGLELFVRRDEPGLFARLDDTRLVLAMTGAREIAEPMPVVPCDVVPAVALDADVADRELGGIHR